MAIEERVEMPGGVNLDTGPFRRLGIRKSKGNPMRSHQLKLLMLFVSPCCLLNCSDIGEVIPPARIVPGVSIDGIQFGETPESVQSKIGKTGSYGSADGGNGKAWFTSHYVDGPHAGLEIFYIDLVCLGQASEPGPVDRFELWAPFAGKTLEGIGIGSPVQDVRLAYGEPQRSWIGTNNEVSLDYYCYGRNWTSYTYEHNVVVRIGMGVLIPPPGEAICP